MSRCLSDLTRLAAWNQVCGTGTPTATTYNVRVIQ